MDKGYDIEAMLERQREIAAEMERLAKEKEELDVAVRVLQRFAISDKSNEPKLGPPRPEGTPTLFKMTESVVRKAQEGGKEGLTAKEIVEEIGREFWPGVQPPQILPQIYQFAKKKRIAKTSDGIFQAAPRDDADESPGLRMAALEFKGLPNE
jgi:hypothetical protein